MSLTLIHRLFMYGITVVLLIAYIYTRDTALWETFKIVLTVVGSVELLRIGPATPEQPPKV